jgi:hypothetical protein
MHSALSLGKTLAGRLNVSAQPQISKLLREYEQEMVPRATEWVLASRQAGLDFQDIPHGLAGVLVYKRS